jgi:hypothetical protein
MRRAKPTVPFGALVQVNGGLTPVTSELQLYASSKCDVIVGLEIVNFPTLLLEGPSESTEVMEGEALSNDVGREIGTLGNDVGPEDGVLEGEPLGDDLGPHVGILEGMLEVVAIGANVGIEDGM